MEFHVCPRHDHKGKGKAMRDIFAVAVVAVICLCTCPGYGQALSIQGMSSELEEAFLDKPKTVEGRHSRMVPGAAASGGGVEGKPAMTEGEKWQARLTAILDIPAAPLPEGISLKMLEAPGTKFIVAVFDTGEEGVVHKARQIAWPRVRTLFTGGAPPFIHIVPISGGTFSAGRTFYTVMNEKDGFTVLYIPQKATRKVSLTFSGEQGSLLTPDGFVCRIKRYTPDTGGIQ